MWQHTVSRLAIIGVLLVPVSALALEDFSMGNPDASLQTSMDLESFLFSEITVASLKAVTLRESPGIVSRISSEEIVKSGARDLIDVLRLVPGFDFGHDLLGVVSVGLRGNWVQEGKISIRLDGQELNELLYAGFEFGHHYPVDLIDHIEIIRGPGSAIYGGFAELAVINIVSKNAAQLNGGQITGNYGQMSKTYGHRNLSVAYGKELGKDFNFTGSVFLGQGHRSDREYVDFFGQPYAMTDEFELTPLMFNVAANYAGLAARFISDRFRTTSREVVVMAYDNKVELDFDSYLTELSYAWQINPSLKLTPSINYKYTESYRENPLGLDDPWLYIHKSGARTTGSLQFYYDVLQDLNLIAGAEYYQEQGKELLPPEYPYLSFVEQGGEVNYYNAAGYAQGLWNTPWVVVTAGARYENHNKYGSSFVPRLGLTKVLDQFHFKLLASRAFRAPSLEIISINETIQPEYTTVYEAETGYAFSSHLFATVNFFDINIHNPIQYQWYVDPDSPDGFGETYSNLEASRNQGMEFEARIKDNWGYATLNYSYYRNVVNDSTYFRVPDHPELNLGLPQHKVCLNASVNLMAGLSLNPSATYLGERYGYTSADADENLILQKFDPIVLANLFLYYEDAFMPNLNLGAGVYNLLDSDYQFVQPYDGSGAPLPGPSREYMVKVAYSF